MLLLAAPHPQTPAAAAFPPLQGQLPRLYPCMPPAIRLLLPLPATTAPLLLLLLPLLLFLLLAGVLALLLLLRLPCLLHLLRPVLSGR